MSNPPKISVLMPAYNAAVYIDETIHSVLSQTMTDWELIIVDDGSTDDTVAHILAFDDPRIRLIEASHGGLLGRVRNIGIKAAVGDYIAFLDADDTYEPEALSLLSQHLDSNPGCKAAYGMFGLIDSQGKPLNQQPFGVQWGEKEKVFKVNQLVSHTWLNVLSSLVPNQFQGLMLRRSLIQTVGLLSEDMAFSFLPDFQYVLRLFVNDFSAIDGLPVVVFRYRQHQGSMTYHPQKFEHSLKSVKYLCDWFFEQQPLLPVEAAQCRALATARQYHHRARAAWRAGSREGVHQVFQVMMTDPAVTPMALLKACWPTMIRYCWVFPKSCATIPVITVNLRSQQAPARLSRSAQAS